MVNKAVGILLLLFRLTSACDFVILAKDGGNLASFVGRWSASSETHNGVPIYFHEDDVYQVMQFSTDGAWDFCWRNQATGPSHCFREVDRAAELAVDSDAFDFEDGDAWKAQVTDWCNPACNLVVLQPCPNTTTVTATTTTSSTSTMSTTTVSSSLTTTLSSTTGTSSVTTSLTTTTLSSTTTATSSVTTSPTTTLSSTTTATFSVTTSPTTTLSSTTTATFSVTTSLTTTVSATTAVSSVTTSSTTTLSSTTTATAVVTTTSLTTTLSSTSGTSTTSTSSTTVLAALDTTSSTTGTSATSSASAPTSIATSTQSSTTGTATATSATTATATVTATATASATSPTTATATASATSATTATATATVTATATATATSPTTATATVTASATSPTTATATATARVTSGTVTAKVSSLTTTETVTSQPEANTFSSTTTTTTETFTLDSVLESLATTRREAAEALNSVLGELGAGGDVVQVVNTTASGTTVAAARLSQLPAGSIPDSVAFSVADTGVKLDVPKAVFSDFLQDGEEAVVGVTVFSDTSGFDGTSTSTGGDIEDVTAAVEIDFYAVGAQSSRQVELGKLNAPLQFTLKATDMTGRICAFWDEQANTWSSEGVTRKDGTSDPGLIVCEAEHLTLFGAIVTGFVGTFVCSQVHLLTSESIAEIATSDWVDRTGSVTFFITLGTSLFLLAWATFLDCYRSSRLSWPNEYLLLPEGPGPIEEAIIEAQSSVCTAPSTPLARAVSAGFNILAIPINFCCSIYAWAQSSTSLREAIDDIMSSWFEFFGDLRSFCEEIYTYLDCSQSTEASSGRCLRVSQSAMASVLASVCQRMAAAKLWVSIDVISLVLEDDNIRELLMDAQKSRTGDAPAGWSYSGRGSLPRAGSSSLWSSSQGKGVASERVEGLKQSGTLSTLGSVQSPNSSTQLGHGSRASSDEEYSSPRDGTWRRCHTREMGHDGRKEAWVTLYEEVNRSVVAQVTNHSKKRHCLRATGWLFLSNHPIGQVMVFDLLSTCKMRTFLFILDHILTLVLVCFFFQAAGTRRQRSTGDSVRDECTDKRQQALLGYRIGRFIAIAIGSAFLGALPMGILESLMTKGLKTVRYEGCPEWSRALRVWRMQEKMVYYVGSLLMVFSIFFITIFLANVSERDHRDWTFAYLIVIAQDLFIMPLVLSCSMPLLGSVLLAVLSRYSEFDRRRLLRHVHLRVLHKTNAMLPLMCV